MRGSKWWIASISSPKSMIRKADSGVGGHDLQHLALTRKGAAAQHRVVSFVLQPDQLAGPCRGRSTPPP